LPQKLVLSDRRIRKLPGLQALRPPARSAVRYRAGEPALDLE